MSNYSATIVRISNITPHPNADRLNLTNIFGNTVIIGKDTKVGDLGVFFPLECQISAIFAESNDLIRRKDEEGKPAGGMLDSNRRIRAIKLRGIPSMGLWLPISCLDFIPFAFTGPPINDYVVKEGEEFDSLMGVDVCKKYVPRTNSSLPGGGSKKGNQAPRESRIVPGQFHFHNDTAQLGKNMHRIDPKDLIAVTVKFHGTSAIAANVLTKRKLSWTERLLSRLKLVTLSDAEYDYIFASRRVIKNEFEETKRHYYSEDLWTRVGVESFFNKLHTGETVYYEIVGYTKDGGFIQKGYDYGMEPGKCSPAVYRITQTAVDGTVVELSWVQVIQRCKELGVEPVPTAFIGQAGDMFPWLRGHDRWHEEFLRLLKETLVNDQDSAYCNFKVPEEGVCLRKEGLNIEVYKLKSFRFLEFETKSLDADTVDIETEQTL